MNGLFYGLLRVDVVTEGAAVWPVLRGRKVWVSFLLVVVICFFGGFISQAHSQPVRDLASEFDKEFGDDLFGNQAVANEVIEQPNDFGGFISSPPVAPAASCFANNSLDRIKKKLGFC
ncbi:hypothetical protein KV580_26555 [Pseudomonas chlororaphis]|nr:hypothetical protein [Pseudomonas chlororaphis]